MSGRWKEEDSSVVQSIVYAIADLLMIEGYGTLIPHVGANMVYADPNATKTEDVAALMRARGGTLIALAADEILLDPHAGLGPVDPQLGDASGSYPATSILKVLEQKNVDKIDDKTLILAEESRKAVAQISEIVRNIVLVPYGPEKSEEIV